MKKREGEGKGEGQITDCFLLKLRSRHYEKESEANIMTTLEVHLSILELFHPPSLLTMLTVLAYFISNCFHLLYFILFLSIIFISEILLTSYGMPASTYRMFFPTCRKKRRMI